MQKFSIFTVILASVMVVVVAEFAMNGYGNKDVDQGDLTFDLPSGLDLTKVAETSVLGAGAVSSDVANDEVEETVEIVDPVATKDTVEVVEVNDFEDENYSLDLSESVYLRVDQVQSAGFSDGVIMEEDHDGLLFKSIYLDDLYDVDVRKWSIGNDTQAYAKAYVFSFGPNSGTDQVYEILKVRASQGLNAEVNESDEFADASFYMNDTRRQNTAFLTAKIGPLIYAFSYPKEYHQQIKNLITLLDLEL